MTYETSLSLLQRLKGDREAPDWNRFVNLYDPLLRAWLRRHSLLVDDSDDVVQNIMAVVVRKVSEFEHNGRTGAFRTWLKEITARCLHSYWRSRKNQPAGVGGSDVQALIADLQDPQSEASQEWDREHDRFVMRKLLDDLKTEFEPKTWLAFQRFALEQIPAAKVAEELDISANAVFIAKSRVLARLRQESQGILDD